MGIVSPKYHPFSSNGDPNSIGDRVHSLRNDIGRLGSVVSVTADALEQGGSDAPSETSADVLRMTEAWLQEMGEELGAIAMLAREA